MLIIASSIIFMCFGQLEAKAGAAASAAKTALNANVRIRSLFMGDLLDHAAESRPMSSISDAPWRN
jgi:hypothetical protein